MDTTSAPHTWTDGTPVRQRRNGRCDGSVTANSTRGALATLMPVLAAPRLLAVLAAELLMPAQL